MEQTVDEKGEIKIFYVLLMREKSSTFSKAHISKESLNYI